MTNEPFNIIKNKTPQLPQSGKIKKRVNDDGPVSLKNGAISQRNPPGQSYSTQD